jgi:hypothetical protein
MVKTQLFIDMLEAGRVTSVTSAHGTSEPSADVRSTTAFGGNPDIEVTSPDDRV